MKTLEVCILAAGMGSRMKSPLPKVLHPLAGKPMLGHLLATVAELNPHKVHVVVGQGAEQVQAAFADQDIQWALQAEQRGTGHAVMQALPNVSDDSLLLILAGDGPLISVDTLRTLLQSAAALTVLTVDQADPTHYGRIIRDAAGAITEIVEERDATPTQRLIREVNTGVMLAQADHLRAWTVGLTTDNEQGEYLLTDIVAIATNAGRPVSPVKAEDPGELQGINNFAQLAAAER
ncbi:NTP transferase domain-containing protein, partial [Pseudomonadales bacterium]|nr:NTP transferase domain-containing protein [Pseudomonadales bacterium]